MIEAGQQLLHYCLTEKIGEGIEVIGRAPDFAKQRAEKE